MDLMFYFTDGALVFSGPGPFFEGSDSSQLCISVDTEGQVEVTFSIFLEVNDGSAGLTQTFDVSNFSQYIISRSWC